MASTIVTLNNQKFKKDPNLGWIDAKTKVPQAEAFSKILDIAAGNTTKNISATAALKAADPINPSSIVNATEQKDDELKLFTQLDKDLTTLNKSINRLSKILEEKKPKQNTVAANPEKKTKTDAEILKTEPGPELVPSPVPSVPTPEPQTPIIPNMPSPKPKFSSAVHTSIRESILGKRDSKTGQVIHHGRIRERLIAQHPRTASLLYNFIDKHEEHKAQHRKDNPDLYEPKPKASPTSNPDFVVNSAGVAAKYNAPAQNIQRPSILGDKGASILNTIKKLFITPGSHADVMNETRNNVTQNVLNASTLKTSASAATTNYNDTNNRVNNNSAVNNNSGVNVNGTVNNIDKHTRNSKHKVVDVNIVSFAATALTALENALSKSISHGKDLEQTEAQDELTKNKFESVSDKEHSKLKGNAVGTGIVETISGVTPTPGGDDKDHKGGGLLKTALGFLGGEETAHLIGKFGGKALSGLVGNAGKAIGGITSKIGGIFGKDEAKVAEKAGGGIMSKISGLFGKGGVKSAEKLGAKELTKIGGKSLLKSGLKLIPGIGLIAGLGFGASRLMHGDVGGALGEVASGAVSNIPIIGDAASLAIDAGLAAHDISDAGKSNDLAAISPPAIKAASQGPTVQTQELHRASKVNSELKTKPKTAVPSQNVMNAPTNIVNNNNNNMSLPTIGMRGSLNISTYT